MRRENKRKGLNRLLVLVLAAAVTMAFSFTSISFAAEETGGSTKQVSVGNLASGQMADFVTDPSPQSKYYDGQEQWDANGALPRVPVSSSLVEGQDYTRIYFFTTDRRWNPTGDPNNHQETAKQFHDRLLKDTHGSVLENGQGIAGPGYIWEFVYGLNKYEGYGPYDVRHSINSILDVEISDQSIYEGDQEPETSYQTQFTNNNPNNYNKYKLSFSRKAGDTPGKYAVQGTFEPTEDSDHLTIIPYSAEKKYLNIHGTLRDGSVGSFSYIVGDSTEGYIFVKIHDGVFTIKKKSHLIYNSNTSQPSEVTSDGKWKPGEESEKLQTAKELNFQNSGYTLTGWNTQADGKGTSYKPGDTYKFTDADDGKDVTLYAQWKENSAPYVPVTPSTPTEEHTVTFHPNNGESNFTQTVPDGGKAVQPEDPAQEGYTFDGWFTDSSLTQAYDFNTPVKGNLDLYAKWTKTVKPVNPVKPVKPSKKVTGILLPKVIAKGKHAQTLTWTALKNVDGYFIYTNHCDEAQGRIPHPFKKVADYKASKARVYTKKNLKTYHNYKYYVAAYKIKNGKKVIVRNSVTVHSVCGNTSARSTNVKSVEVSKHAVTLKKGQTYKVKASISKLNKKRAFLDATHCGLLRYLTADSKIATVNYKTGVIKAKKAGKTTVYVLGVNGIRDKVTVTVK